MISFNPDSTTQSKAGRHDSIHRCKECTINGEVGGTIVPVIAVNDNTRLSEVEAGEPEIMGAKRVVAVHYFTEMLCDIAVVSNLMTGITSEIEAKVVKASSGLLKYDSLGLDFAYLFSDDPVQRSAPITNR